MLVSGAALLLACGAFITYDVISIRDGMVYNLSMQAQIVALNSNSALLFNDPHSAENTLSGLKAGLTSFPPAYTRAMGGHSPRIGAALTASSPRCLPFPQGGGDPSVR